MSIFDWLFGKQKQKKAEEDKLTAVHLPSLPENMDDKKLKKAKLIYDPTEKRLSFLGKMSDNERSRLSAFSNDKKYKRAIRSLFLRSQGSTKEATWPMLSLQAGLGDKDYVYSNATLAPLKAGHGISFVEYISDALWNYPKFRNNALKILHLVASADAMDRNAATYAKKELADWEEEELHNNIITVTNREGFIEITCPECGAHCPSLLSANDPVLETRSWGADCPACGRAFNFKVVVTEPKAASNKDSELVSIFEPKCIKCGSLVKQRISNVLSSLDGMGSATCTRCNQRYTYRISDFKLTLEFETIEASYTGPRKSVCEPVKRISKQEYRQIG